MSARLENLRVVLVATRNPLNIGAAARAMSNFGASDLRLVRPYETSFREARSAVGAGELLTRAGVFNSVAEAVADCRVVVGTTAASRRDIQHPLRGLEAGARAIRRQFGAGPVALLFGSEKRGLSNDDFSHCHWLVRIPTRKEHSAMNLGQAVAVCLYELARPGRAEDKMTTAATKSNISAKAAPSRAEDLERLTQLLFHALHVSGYVKPKLSSATEEKVRRLVRRMDLSAGDAELWLGMLRQIGWKLG